MRINFSYDKKLVIQALRYHFISRPEIKVLLVLVNVFAIVAAVLLYMHKVSPLAFLLSSVLWITLMIVFWIILPRIIYKRASTFKEIFTMMFSEKNIRIENERGYNEWKWSQFSTFIESPHFFHLYFNSRSFFLVPKAAVEQDGNTGELRKMLQKNIKR